MRVLLIEDDQSTAQVVTLALKVEGIQADVTDLGYEGVDLAKRYDYDAIQLDLGLPDISGLDVLRRIRAAKIRTPVIVVTGRADMATKIAALSGGADDFMTKPFHRDELVARIRAIVRRSKGHAESTIKAGPLAVHIDRKAVEVNGVPVRLTDKLYQIMELLALRQGTTVTRDVLMNHLYGAADDEPDPKILDVFVCKLRAKLRTAGVDGLIENNWGRGYLLRAPAEAAA